MRKKVIIRLKGGIGNQLFQYAAAKRLAEINSDELIVDSVSGFIADTQYRREYSLGNFEISARLATPSERLEPFSKFRRRLLRSISAILPAQQRPYIYQRGCESNLELLTLRDPRDRYLEGYWQSEIYFKDTEAIIRKEFQIIPPIDHPNVQAYATISGQDSVALHLRWFSKKRFDDTDNLSLSYYKNATKVIEKSLRSPKYYVFSDDVAMAKSVVEKLSLTATYVDWNDSGKNAYADLWLFARCKHHIIANSTFSFWGAWLGENAASIVISPQRGFQEAHTVPERWVKI